MLHKSSEGITTLVTTKKRIYAPEFNTNTGIYEDKLPFLAYSRNHEPITCRCKPRFSMQNTTQFKSHIKGKCHIMWLEDYHEYTADADNALKEKNEIKKELELCKRKCRTFAKNKLLLEAKLESNTEVIELKKENKMLEQLICKQVAEYEQLMEKTDTTIEQLLEQVSDLRSEVIAGKDKVTKKNALIKSNKLKTEQLLEYIAECDFDVTKTQRENQQLKETLNKTQLENEQFKYELHELDNVN